MARKRTGIVLIWAAAICGLISGGIAFWWWNLNRVPELQVSVPSLPIPNGWDRIVDATKRMTERNIVNGITGKGESHTYTLAEREKVLSDNRSVLQAVEDAWKLPVQAPIPATPSRPVRGLSDMRQLTRLIVFAGKIYKEKCDYNTAVNYYLDAIQLGAVLPTKGNLTAKIMGNACESLGHEPLKRVIDKLDAHQVRSALQRMENIRERRAMLAEALEVEKAVSIRDWLAIFKKMNLVQVGLVYSGEVESVEKLTTWMLGKSDETNRWAHFWTMVGMVAQCTRTSKTEFLNDYSRMMDAGIIWARQPYDPTKTPSYQPKAFLNEVLFPIFVQSRFRDVRNQTQNALLLADLALRAYVCEHQNFPQTLDELVANGYLRQIPGDPFARAENVPLRYRRISASRFLLYSVGPDVQDDGGQEIREHLKDGRVKFDEHSTGDIVLSGKSS